MMGENNLQGESIFRGISHKKKRGNKETFHIGFLNISIKPPKTSGNLPFAFII